jgi:AhpD family alkylhydroperoxidase
MYVPTKPVGKYPWLIRLFFWNQRRRYGKILEPGMLWGRSPFVFSTLALLYGALDRKRSPIEPELRSLLTVRVSQINHCEFCVDINTATLMKRCKTPEKIDALSSWRESSLFSGRERCALAYCDAITRSDQDTTPEMMADLERHFDHDALVELTAVICFQNMSSKFNAALDVPAQGFCRIPAMAAKQDTDS